MCMLTRVDSNLVYVEANASIQQYETEDGKKGSSISLVQSEYFQQLIEEPLN